MTARRWTLIVLSLLVFACYAYALPADAPLVASFIDVGQGDSCWLHLPSGNNPLVDRGKPHAGPTVRLGL